MKSIRNELLNKSREAALAAVQIFNNPNITFKSEIYIVLMVIGWTYLLHAYFRGKKIDYRYFRQENNRKRYDRTRNGAFKHWELERCLNDAANPLDKDTTNNLRFLISLRHEIEHQMTTRIDDIMSARFQAACLNYNEYIQKLFSGKYAIDKHLSFSLQFSSLSDKQVDLLGDQKSLPPRISRFIEGFDGALSEQEYNSPRFAYRVLFVAKTANHKGQADRVIEFVKSDSALASKINAEYVAIKEVERKKYRPGEIVKIMRSKGFGKFNIQHHTELWQKLDAKKPEKGFGTDVIAGTWFWYEKWFEEVKRHCEENKALYT
jgi:hypothetical protein